jgi:hypothetical protein
MAILLGAGVAIYGFPPEGDPSGADVIFVIGPPTDPRLDAAMSLRTSGTGPAMIVSVQAPDPRNEFAAFRLSVCAEPDVLCARPSPYTTKGEALMLEDYARTHDVHKVAVITFTPHVARTRYIFARCAPDLDVQVIGVDEHLSLGDWVYQFGYQTTAFVKAAATPCASDDE